MSIRGNSISNYRSKRGVSQISQFIPVMYILFLVMFFPLMNLASLFVAAAVQYLSTNDIVSKASTQADYATALQTMVNEAYSFQQSSGLAKFISMTPSGGYTGCGDDLYVITTDVGTGAVTRSQADVPTAQPVTTAGNMYELSVTSSYSVAPLVNLSSVPLLGSVPGLGQPVNLSFTASRPVEHPGGLIVASSTAGSSGSVTPFNRIVSGGSSSSVASSTTWRTPNIYAQIAAAGQTVVNVNIIMVQANNTNWTSSGMGITPGESVWIDTQAVGTWSIGASSAGFSLFDANGYGPPLHYDFAPPLEDGALIGEFGVPNGTPFMVGDTLLNYPSTAPGLLGFIMNDDVGNYYDNRGAQMVRVIVTSK